MSSDMFGREGLLNSLKDTHKIVVFNNRGHYNVEKDEYGKIHREGDDGTASNITGYMPDPARCKQEHGIDPYTLDKLVDDGIRVLEKHGIKEPVDVMGFSLGAFESIGFAAKYPEKVRKIAVGKGFSRYHDVIRFGKNILSGPVFQGMYWLWCNARPKFSDERDYGCNVPLGIVDEYAKHVLNMDLSEHEKKINSPTLVIECNDDFILGTPFNNIKDASRVKIKSCGHIFHAKNDEMYEKIERFLDASTTTP
jgi:pimeloyl-ACP methyl ester carboxylesterase